MNIVCLMGGCCCNHFSDPQYTNLVACFTAHIHMAGHHLNEAIKKQRCNHNEKLFQNICI